MRDTILGAFHVVAPYSWQRPMREMLSTAQFYKRRQQKVNVIQLQPKAIQLGDHPDSQVPESLS